jgi:hypothetical protein
LIRNRETGRFPWEKPIPVDIETEEVWIGKSKEKSVAKSTNKAVILPRSEKGVIDLGQGQVYWGRVTRRL